MNENYQTRYEMQLNPVQNVKNEVKISRGLFRWNRSQINLWYSAFRKTEIPTPKYRNKLPASKVL